ncbi:Tail protein I [Escherichia coli]|uniref:Tail protein I n=1 Tax=Escherichia coli TaxID=562 RepID=A0A376ZK85_ECOLX|nr:Tail protein I [Escherichia coli]
MSNSLLPPSASNFMRYAEAVGTRITDIPVDLNTLWSPDTCPVHSAALSRLGVFR